jgi:murein DD-endopeptidase MepM/ murein hydrolase activator NlpD
MRAVVNIACGRSWSRVALLGALAAGVAGCSPEASRFGNPGASPYASRKAAPAEVTGSVHAAPTNQISSQPLAPPPSTSAPATVASTGVSGGGQGMASYNPAAAPRAAAGPDFTGSVARHAQPGWVRDGGIAVMVGSGETADSVARKYRVPVGAILQANNLSSPAAVRPGQRIIIPRNASLAAATASGHQTAAVKPSVSTPASPATGANVHVVAPGQTLMSIARRYHKPLTEIAAANKIPPHTLVKIGDRIVIPGKLVAAKPVPTVIASPKLQAPPRATGTVVAQSLASAEPSSTARVATAGLQATADASATASTGAPTFRWPVRGRVITGFGPKPNGQHSDGIDLAVPEGTAVRASEDGVVAYAGSELKGYGNLILVRHANGFVTAYAHASEIMVKRNDEVRRGQVIAKSGQSGSVTSPQLHFEIRKGSAPVDPTQYLPSGA